MIWIWALAMRVLRKVPTRWMPEDRYDEMSLWLVAKMWRHQEAVERAFGLTPARVTRGPRPFVVVQQPTTTTGGSNVTLRWEQG